MRVEVLGVVAVANGDARIVGQALGGRRARVALVALALSRGLLPAERLAAVIWPDGAPPTWQAALRGIVRGLRAACAPVGGGEQRLITTAPSGYVLASGIEVDVTRAAADVRAAAALLVEGRPQAAAELAEPVSRLAGDQLLPEEDAGWLEPHRRAVDLSAQHAARIAVEAHSLLGHHEQAIEAARRAVASSPLDEAAHRALIAALDRAGDRSGAVQAYEECRELLGEHLGIDPSPETVEVYLRVLSSQADQVNAPIPAEMSSFIGRTAETAALSAAVGRAGLVTLTGRGGVGKSRLAIRVAARRGAFVGGCLWVSLAPVAQDALVASSVALTLGVSPGSDDPADKLAERLAPLGRTLLVLDGCETVVDGVASLVAALLARAPMLTVLATSRIPLAIEGERLVSVDPLTAPGQEGDLADSDQVRLLIDRVRESGGDLDLNEAVTPYVMALCERCAGLPLALELVAAQLAAMPPGDLLDHLQETGSMPEDGLRSIARSSYVLLDRDEAAVFRRLAVLDGPAGLPLIRQVVAGGAVAPVRVVRILRELAARGLLTIDRRGPHWRYQQDDDLHRFARELLVEHGEEQAAFERLADAIRDRLPDDARASPTPFRADVTALLGSVRSLFGAAVGGRADADRSQELAFRLHRYFATTGVHEGRFWLSRLLATRTGGPWTAYATYALGYLSYWSGDTADAMRNLESAAPTLDGPYRAHALIFLAGLLDDVDRGTEAIEYVRLSIDAAAPFDVDLQCSAAMGMGSVLAERADPAAAGYARDAIELCRAGGSVEHLGMVLPTAAMICWQVGDLDRARAYVAEALPLNAATVRIARVVLMSAGAGIALHDRDLDTAVEFGTTADKQAGQLGIEREVPLIRAVVSRALLAGGDIIAAARYGIGAIEGALALTVGSPMAVSLEAAALILHEARAADRAGLGELLHAARTLRRRGDRPGPVTLGRAVADLLATLDDPVSADVSVDPREAARHALDLLADVVGEGRGVMSHTP